MKIPTKEEISIIEAAIDKAVDEYTQGSHVVFGSESQRQHEKFRKNAQQAKAWKSKKQCVVPNCAKSAIKNSHALSRMMSLAPISEMQHLLTPEFNQNTGHLKLKEIGIKQASTFPGFCIEHEDLFSEFESRGRLENSRDIYLQIYRSACRELFRSTLDRVYVEDIISSFEKKRNKYLLDAVYSELDKTIKKDLELKKIEVNNDPVAENLKLASSSAKKHEKFVAKIFVPAMEKAVFCNDSSNIHIFATSIDVQIPVALSGTGYFRVKHQGVSKEVMVMTGVIPIEAGTIITIAGHVSDKKHIDCYIGTWMTNGISMLSMIESWMVNGTDQWFVNPSVWNGLPGKRKDKILAAIIDCGQDIGQEYGYSIFDELRTDFLSMCTNEGPSIVDFEEFIEKQKNKMI